MLGAEPYLSFIRRRFDGIRQRHTIVSEQCSYWVFLTLDWKIANPVTRFLNNDHCSFFKCLHRLSKYCRQAIDHVYCSRIVEPEQYNAGLFPTGKSNDFTEIEVKS